MTLRRPLVLVSGGMKELPAGDMVPKWAEIASYSIGADWSVIFTNISQNFNDLLVRVEGVSHNDTGSGRALMMYISTDGSTWSSPFGVGQWMTNGGVWNGNIQIPNYTAARGGISPCVSAIGSLGAGGVPVNYGYYCAGGIKALKFASEGQQLDAGVLRLLGG